MQLLAVFALLYLWEGLLFGIPGAVLFASARRGFRARRCDRAALLPLRPGRVAVLAAPFPFRTGADGVVSDVTLRRLGSAAVPRALGFDALNDVVARGAMLRVGGRSFARAASAEHAAAAAARLVALGPAPSAERAAAIDAAERDATDVAALRARLDIGRRRVRWLGAVCDAYLAALFLLLPIAIATLGEASALLASLPVLATLHIAALVMAFRAHRALRPEARSERFETLLAAALFPPHLLRLAQLIFLAGAGAPRPETAAAALLTAEERVVFLRRALAECERAGGEQATVLAVAASAGIDEMELHRPPVRADSAAAAYCPVCLEEYRAGFDRCADCRAPLVPFGSGSST